MTKTQDVNSMKGCDDDSRPFFCVPDRIPASRGRLAGPAAFVMLYEGACGTLGHRPHTGQKGEKAMNIRETARLKYVAIGFACLVIAMSVLRTQSLLDYAPGVAGAIMLSVLVASAHESRTI